MRIFARFALSIGTAAALLAGCGGSPPIDAPTGFAAQRVAPAADAREPLLYVAHKSVVSIISLPQDKALTRITGYGYITGVCSDTSGNVWVPNLRRRHWYVDEFARGGTKAIKELRAPHRWASLGACAVDPSNGNLAVMGANIDGDNVALIWSGAGSGKPAMYSVGFCAVGAAYDDASNLFITGWACGSTFNPYFGELAKGSGHTALIKIDKPPGVYGGVQWDGRYVAVAVAAKGKSAHSVLYRVKVSGTTGEVVGTVKPQGFHVGFFGSSSGFFVLHDAAVIGTAGNGALVWAWPYPTGGKPVKAIARYKGIIGIALSR
ncbi:MAG: hypothetical protein JO324_06120 [Candidatus Eremiobacteraeota bacterium]|nr:hypothetical protein [Candidatus Eremiobacteraeota bacterium]